MRLRSVQEYRYRLWQVLENLRLYAMPPALPSRMTTAPEGLLPRVDVSRLRGTPYAERLHRTAQSILARNIPLLGLTVDTGTLTAWRKDPLSGIESAAVYFKRLPYLDVTACGDHKLIWELSRHQHLVALAQDAVVRGDTTGLTEVWMQLESWLDQNPFQCGMNWTSALEVAFRALSWLWILHLAGDEMPERLRPRFLTALYHHGRHLAVNLSTYFSPNTHLLGEALALHALGACLPQWPGAAEWAEEGHRIVAQELHKQVRPDGGYFEQSTYYHVYALDMFLFHAVLLDRRGGWGDGEREFFRQRLRDMGDFLHTVMGPARTLPLLGDDDGGRFFSPYGDRLRFGRGTLAACAQWLGEARWCCDPEDAHELAAWWLDGPAVTSDAPAASRWFPDSGLAVSIHGDNQVIVDAGPFGPFGAGHSHADTLSLVVRCGGEDILIDPGTYTYVGDPQWRDWFRGTEAHNTVVIGDLDQAQPAGPFRWEGRPELRVLGWRQTEDWDELEAECGYQGFRHRRRVRHWKRGLVTIFDEVSGEGSPSAEQWFHLGCEAAAARLTVDPGATVTTEPGWRSTVMGVKFPAPAMLVRKQGPLPLRFGAVVRTDPALTGELQEKGGSYYYCVAQTETMEIPL